MKNINIFIIEKLKISKPKKIVKVKHTLFPESRSSLDNMIRSEIEKKWK